MTIAILAAERWLNDGPLPSRHPWRRRAGAAIVVLGVAGMLASGASHLWHWATSGPHIANALLATLLTAGATGAGALPVLIARSIPARIQYSMLGFGAGVMLAATAFSLVIPGIVAGTAVTGSRIWAAGIVGSGIAAGGLALMVLDRLMPHEHFVKSVEEGRSENLRRIWLFVLAITLHNFPEGLAVGVGFGANDIASASALALGIGIQNIPEGLVVALALVAAGYARGFSAAIALASGLVEPVGGLLGAAMLSISQAMLPWGLAFAAGAMLFVVSHEIIPESHRKGHEREATIGLLAGFVVMMILDTALG